MIRTLCLSAALATLAGPVLADPCKRIPDRGQMPPEARRGQVFAGPVVYVGDGDSLCVDVIAGRGGDGWLEVRLADFRSPELADPGGRAARDTLRRIAFGRRVRCVAENRTYDRVAAVCRIEGTSLGVLMRRAGVAEGGR